MPPLAHDDLQWRSENVNDRSAGRDNAQRHGMRAGRKVEDHVDAACAVLRLAKGSAHIRAVESVLLHCGNRAAIGQYADAASETRIGVGDPAAEFDGLTVGDDFHSFRWDLIAADLRPVDVTERGTRANARSGYTVGFSRR